MGYILEISSISHQLLIESLQNDFHVILSWFLYIKENNELGTISCETKIPRKKKADDKLCNLISEKDYSVMVF